MLKKLLAITALYFLCTLAISEENVIMVINTAEELAAIEPNGNYVLGNDIDMKDIDWLPVEFNGKLDGAGHTIYNLTVTRRSEENAVTIDGNHKNYDTELVGLFSKSTRANIHDLNVIGAYLEYTTANNAFASVLCAWSDDTVFTNVSVSGRVYLYTGGKMGGVAGIVGFGTGQIIDSSAEVTLVYVDTNTKVKCEQFLGGANACGYMDVINFSVYIDGYASVHGYVHNGGVVGMHHNHDANYKPNKVSGCDTTGQITFFEHNSDRRAYCKATVGEKLNNSLTLSDNKGDGFTSHEVKKYTENLLPEMCEEPEYWTATVAPTEHDAGYEIHSCMKCGYTYKTNYTLPTEK